MYYGYLTTTIQLNFAIFMACVSFLRPFMESMVSGGMATTVQSTNTYSTKSSKLSTLLSSRSNRHASKPKSSYSMENLSEVGLSESPGTFGKSESNTNGSHNDLPSIGIVEVHFAPANTNNHEDLGPLRPDKATSFSRVSNARLEDNEVRSARSREMVITRTREWNIQEEHKHGRGEDTSSERSTPTAAR